MAAPARQVVTDIGGGHDPVARRIAQIGEGGDQIVLERQRGIARHQRLEPVGIGAIGQSEAAFRQLKPPACIAPASRSPADIERHGIERDVRLGECARDILAEARIQPADLEARRRAHGAERYVQLARGHDAGIGEADRTADQPDRRAAEPARKVERWRACRYIEPARPVAHDRAPRRRAQGQAAAFEREVGERQAVEADLGTIRPQRQRPARHPPACDRQAQILRRTAGKRPTRDRLTGEAQRTAPRLGQRQARDFERRSARFVAAHGEPEFGCAVALPLHPAAKGRKPRAAEGDIARQKRRRIVAELRLDARQRQQPCARSPAKSAARHHEGRTGRPPTRGQVGGEGASARFAAQDIGDALCDRGDESARPAPPQLGDRRIGLRSEAQAIALDIAAPVEPRQAGIAAQRPIERDQRRIGVGRGRTAQGQRVFQRQHIAAQARAHAPADPVRRVSARLAPPEPQSSRARKIGERGIALQFQLRRPGGERQAIAFYRAITHRPVEGRNSIPGRQRTIEACAFDPAGIGGDLGGAGREDAGKAVIDPPLALDLEADRAVARLDQPAPVANRDVDFGKAGWRRAFAVDHAVETAETHATAPQYSVKTGARQRDPPDLGRTRSLAQLHQHPLRSEVGRFRVADDEVGQHRRFGSDAFDRVGCGQIVGREPIFDDIARDPLAREPQGNDRDREKEEHRRWDHPALLAPPWAWVRAWVRRKALLRFGERCGLGQLGLGVLVDPGHSLRPLRERLPKGNAA